MTAFPLSPGADTMTLTDRSDTSRSLAVMPAARDVDVVIPVFNEERVLAASVMRLHRFLQARMPFSWRIVIVDNASTDLTAQIGVALAEELADVAFMRLAEKGRGRALRAAWSGSRARAVAYMDVDLSTDLTALLPLVAPLLSGHSEVAIGTRLAPGARVERCVRRELISRSYNFVLRGALHARFSDAQCGFKALRTDVARELLPEVVDEGWFFDTELLVLAQRRGMRIHEVAVDWVEDSDSRVDILATASTDLRGVLRMLRRRSRRAGSSGRTGVAGGSAPLQLTYVGASRCEDRGRRRPAARFRAHPG